MEFHITSLDKNTMAGAPGKRDMIRLEYLSGKENLKQNEALSK